MACTAAGGADFVQPGMSCPPPCFGTRSGGALCSTGPAPCPANAPIASHGGWPDRLGSRPDDVDLLGFSRLGQATTGVGSGEFSIGGGGRVADRNAGFGSHEPVHLSPV